jgi:hypothetical protein
MTATAVPNRIEPVPQPAWASRASKRPGQTEIRPGFAVLPGLDSADGKRVYLGTVGQGFAESGRLTR